MSPFKKSIRIVISTVVIIQLRFLKTTKPMGFYALTYAFTRRRLCGIGLRLLYVGVVHLIAFLFTRKQRFSYGHKKTPAGNCQRGRTVFWLGSGGGSFDSSVHQLRDFEVFRKTVFEIVVSLTVGGSSLNDSPDAKG